MLFLFVFIGSMLGQAHAAIPSSEREALIALYNATDGDNWTNNTGWKTAPVDPGDGFALSGTECTTPWNGVTCDGDTVIELNLYQNNLINSIPDSNWARW